jgi:hypothetical protein
MKSILRTSSAVSILVGTTSIAPLAFAMSVPFEEPFATDAANWKNSASSDLTYVAIGGADGGGYVSTTFAFASTGSDTPVLFRGQEGFDSSGNLFVGDWIADNVTTLRAKVRHNAPEPLNFFTRFASPLSFPGAVAVDSSPVPPGVWTPIKFQTISGSPQFVSFEGSDFETVFANVGNVQIGASRPAALETDATLYTFDLDQVSVVPEPAVCLLACIAAAGLGCSRW